MLFIFHRQDSSYTWSIQKAPVIWLAYKSQFNKKYKVKEKYKFFLMDPSGSKMWSIIRFSHIIG